MPKRTGPRLAPVFVLEHGVDEALDHSTVALREPAQLDSQKRPVVLGPRRTGQTRCRLRLTSWSTDPGENFLHRHLERPRHPLQDVRARIGKQTDRTDGLFAACFEIPPQALGDLGPAGGVATTQSALLALLGEPSPELDPLLGFVHGASVPVQRPRVQPVSARRVSRRSAGSENRRATSSAAYVRRP
jgi:hypothetical protein